MRILGIETSCDETAVCLIEADGSFENAFSYKILGNALLSQIEIHRPYGGVFPNLAKREHALNLVPLLEQALQEAGELTPNNDATSGALLIPLKQTLEREQDLFERLVPFALKYQKPNIDAIAVTNGPGLEPALWVGVNFAKALSLLWNIPVVAVNHMEGHVVLSAATETSLSPIEFPLLSLLISGGHTELVLSRNWMSYELIGETKDDAVGEAFDKVARLLGLPYPGGPEISKLAHEARSEGREYPHKLPRPMIDTKDFDFSFAGLKTAVRRHVDANPGMSDDEKSALAREFEEACTDVIIKKTLNAIDEHGARALVVGGGVSANTFIRERLSAALQDYGGVSLLIPPSNLATDNALMIALAGYFHAEKEHFAVLNELKAHGTLRLAKRA